jgi:hypothetical protein
LSGAGTVLWHSIFWRGWPGDTERGDLPLRLRGVNVGFLEGGASVGIAGAID